MKGVMVASQGRLKEEGDGSIERKRGLEGSLRERE